MRMLAILLSLILGAHGSEWTYSEGPVGQEHWPDYYAACGGQRQSPIKLQKKTVRYNPSLKELKLKGYEAQQGKFSMTNNGHTVQITLLPTMRMTAPDGTKYIAEQMHFHWGGRSSEMSGSEHTIDGRRFMIEIHVVHYNSKYKSYDIAKDAPDGLAVLAALYEVQDNAENTYYSKLISQLQNIKYPGQSTTLAGVDIHDLLPGNLHDYYTYLGSLTTPPCTENVRWFVLAEPISLSSAQVWKIENSLFDHQNETLHNNYRRTQPLNNRVVEANFKYLPNHHSEFKYYLREILGIVTDLRGSIEKKKPKEKNDD
ncbi:carbonic anhydrase 6 [Trichechus manatus latirostris]|uniref:Carbonic anhydrase n=1 Tax=Trichechus manatus latirostris TaxID=127582 RepID=A0A2Y9E302_TRIMA|nr:carbonic anhydrase 6 [Trichechus manatus latirostris]